jgi:hypothetical protein
MKSMKREETTFEASQPPLDESSLRKEEDGHEKKLDIIENYNWRR